jgi:hypothetical protein
MKSHLTAFIVLLLAISSAHALEARDKANKLAKDGNFKEALALYQQILADPVNGGKPGAEDVRQVHNCIQSLNDYEAFDATMQPIAATFPNDWRVLAALGDAYAGIFGNGFIVAGEFRRGYQRGDQGDPANATARDRVRALQLTHQAISNVPKDEADIKAVSYVYQRFASIIMGNFGYAQSWQLQDLTDLKTLPDYEANSQHNYARNVGIPVNDDGSPLFYYLPKTWDAAKNDGERWRWLLQEAARWDSFICALSRTTVLRFHSSPGFLLSMVRSPIAR